MFFALYGVRSSVELLIQGPHYHSKAHPPTHPQNFVGELWSTELTVMECQSEAFLCPFPDGMLPT